MSSYNELKTKERGALALADKFAAEAEQAKAAEIREDGIAGWRGYNFESSSGLTPEFAEFAAAIKKELKKRMTGYEMVSFMRGHFFCSAFMKELKSGKLVYISFGDVRYSPNDWIDNLLIRTAQHDKDYSGGRNLWTDLINIKKHADELTK